MMKCLFGMHINIKVFYKLILLFWVCVARHAQSTQNKTFVYPQYLQKNVEDEVDFLPADKHESFLQVDSVFLGVHSQGCSKCPK